MFSYHCPVCGVSSRPYLTRLSAENHGWRHRDLAHWGDYPDGEHTRRVHWYGTRRHDAVVVATVFAVLLAASLVARFAGGGR
jgi:hypothetical protein